MNICFFKNMLRIVQHAIAEIKIAKNFSAKTFCLRGSIGRAVDFRPNGPRFDPTPGFLRVWLKKISSVGGF